MLWNLRARDVPARLAVGAFVLNSGLTKRKSDTETATGLHGFAAGTYPVLHKLDPVTFTRTLSTTEIALGSALLLPVVPTAVAGAGLTGFATGLLGLYLRTPGMRREDGLRPTDSGLTVAKDIWLLGIGLGFVLDAVVGTNQR